MMPLDPALHDEYRRKIREARARQAPTVPKGTKFTDEHRARLSAAIQASTTHRSKNQDGRKNTQYKGGRLDKNGYRVVGKWDMEHRVVMAQMLGRQLLKHETVHHRNGDRADNRPCNLELWSSRQPKGQRIEDKVQWAKEILALYGELIDLDGKLCESPGVHPEEHF